MRTLVWFIAAIGTLNTLATLGVYAAGGSLSWPALFDAVSSALFAAWAVIVLLENDE